MSRSARDPVRGFQRGTAPTLIRRRNTQPFRVPALDTFARSVPLPSRFLDGFWHPDGSGQARRYNKDSRFGVSREVALRLTLLTVSHNYPAALFTTIFHLSCSLVPKLRRALVARRRQTLMSSNSGIWGGIRGRISGKGKTKQPPASPWSGSSALGPPAPGPGSSRSNPPIPAESPVQSAPLSSEKFGLFEFPSKRPTSQAAVSPPPPQNANYVEYVTVLFHAQFADM